MEIEAPYNRTDFIEPNFLSPKKTPRNFFLAKYRVPYMKIGVFGPSEHNGEVGFGQKCSKTSIFLYIKNS